MTILIGGMIKVNVDLKEMSYKEFKDWCNERACDGQWNMLEAMACLDVIDSIDSIKVKNFLGFTKKKATMKAREEEWKKRNYTSIS